MQTIKIQPMSEAAFTLFGDLIDFNREPDYPINNGMCDRYHALATADVTGERGCVVVSLGRAKPYQLPLTITMMERHPLGSQVFMPLQKAAFLVVVAPDDDGKPGTPIAFITEPGQGVNYHRGTWHAVLTPLDTPADFLIVDRGGDDENLEEFFFEMPYTVIESEPE